MRENVCEVLRVTFCQILLNASGVDLFMERSGVFLVAPAEPPMPQRGGATVRRQKYSYGPMLFLIQIYCNLSMGPYEYFWCRTVFALGDH